MVGFSPAGPAVIANEEIRGGISHLGKPLWASVSEEVEKEKLLSGKGRIKRDEWKSGDRLWLVELIAPTATKENKLRENMLQGLASGPFKGKTFKFQKIDTCTGKKEVVEMKC